MDRKCFYYKKDDVYVTAGNCNDAPYFRFVDIHSALFKKLFKVHHQVHIHHHHGHHGIYVKKW